MLRNKTALVAFREIHENVRTKGFWLGILALPLIMTLAFTVPAWLNKMKDARSYAVMDRSGWLAEAVERRATERDVSQVLAWGMDRQARGGSAWEDVPPPVRSAVAAGAVTDSLRGWWETVTPDQARAISARLGRARFVRVDLDGRSEEELNRATSEGTLFAWFIVGEDPIERPADSRYASRNLTDEDLREWFTGHATAELRERRYTARDIDRATSAWIEQPLRVEVVKLGRGGEVEAVETRDVLRQWAPIAFTYLLWMAIFGVSQGLLLSTIEEKSNRVLEVLLSAVSHRQLLVGKVLGVAGTGVITVATWSLFFILAALFAPALLERVFDTRLPLDLTPIATDPLFVGSFIVYFLLGYLLYAVVLVGIGSFCNTIQEAQNLLMPVMMILMVPLLAMFVIAEDPGGSLARVLSYIPLFTPFVMMSRAAVAPGVLEYLLTTVLLIGSIALAFWVAVRVFRYGILSTGKPPKWREILRWLRGATPEAPRVADAEAAGS